MLSAVRLNGEASKYRSFLQAVLTAWNRTKIDETTKRLETIRAELQFRILVCMKEENIQALDDATRKVIESVLNSKADLAASLEVHTNELLRQQKISEASASKRHEQLLDMVSGMRIADISPQDVLREIRAKLNYEKKDDRFDDIAEAHRNTFDWILQEDSFKHTSWPDLGKWLQKDTGIYWISGKAGSGKSTLMKFLQEDMRLKEALKLWAGDSTLLVVSFYFWNAGTDLQKSQEGLFRSLLFQALEQEPSLGPVLFPEQYEFGAKWTNFPTFHGLRRGFERLTNRLDGSFKVAMLIDGLDEFDATHVTIAELAEIFMAATQSPHWKTLVSSRPLPAFEAAFAGQPKLRLHELTHKDITAYVDDKLSGHPRITELAIDDSAGTKALIAEIVNSASGVFLWVKLVVRTLLEGLQNYDNLDDLHRRLMVLPRDLEKLFRHMLRNIPTEYKAQSSRMFQILRCNDLHSTIYELSRSSHSGLSPILHQSTSLTALGLFFTELEIDAVLQADIAPLATADRRRRQTEVEGRLRSRCAGLLELRSRKEGRGRTLDGDFEVVYLHKTVAEFLERDDVWSEIEGFTKGKGFDPHVSLLQSLVMRIKCIEVDPPRPHYEHFSEQPLHDLWRLVSTAMDFARFAETSTGTAARKLLDELDKAMSSHFRLVQSTSAEPIWRSDRLTSWCDTYEEDYNRPVPWHDNFLAFTVRHGLTLYVQSKIRQLGKGCIQKEGRPLLDYACRPEPSYGGWSETIRPDIVATLLQNGADPNQKFNCFSPWQNALYTPTRDPVRWVTVLKLLVLHGADPNAFIQGREKLSKRSYRKYRKSSLWLLRDHFDSLLKEDEKLDAPVEELKMEVIGLIRLLEERGAKSEEWHEINGVFKKVSPSGQSTSGGSDPASTQAMKSSSTVKIDIIKRARRLLRRVFKRSA